MLHKDFIERTRKLLRGEYDSFEAALDTQPPVSIRINPFKQDGIPVKDNFITDNTENIPWCETGRYLAERPSFTFDPLFHAGIYYVQEAASMFTEQAVKIILEDDGIRSKQIAALDLCAAPGGKSTLLQSLLPPDSLLVSNEVIRSRSMILAENLAKWGLPNNIVTNNDPKDIGELTHVFDIILADLPCSGEGMFRKDIASRDEWSIDNVKLCAGRQRRIIHDAWNALKPGGYLIYSTCTFNTEENEENVYTLAGELRAEIIPIPIKEEWNIASTLCHDIPVYRFFPHHTKGEGFFLALLRKSSCTTGDNRTKDKKYLELKEPVFTKTSRETGRKKTNRLNNKPAVSEQVKNMILNPGKFTFYDTNNIFALPSIHDNLLKNLSEQLNIISAGITLGEYKGSDFIPFVSLALSTVINTGSFPTVALSREQAIKYLQREAITLPGDTPKGHVIVTFGNKPLGFVKNIGNRANNLYPQEWRIRSRSFI